MNTLTVRAAAWVAILAGIAGIGLGVLVATPDIAAIQEPRDLLPACVSEDAHNCYWDGGSNGSGASFVDFGGVAYYPGPRSGAE